MPATARFASQLAPTQERTTGYAHIPLTTRLARSLAGQLADVCDPDNLSHVAQLYYQDPNFSRIDLENAVKDF